MITFSDLMSGLALILSFLAWLKIREDSKKAYNLAINPSWFVDRMMSDEWYFGLVTNQGQIIAINKINSISDDGKWLEVTLLTNDEVSKIEKRIPHNIQYLSAVADDRITASVLVSNIVLAFEIASS